MLLTRKLTFGGIATALVLAVLSVSYVSPTADLALFTLSSFFIALVVIEAGFKTGLVAYLASGLLVTAVLGIYHAVPFIVLFGLYPLLKGLVEKYMGRLPAYIAKGVFFFMVSASVLFLFKEESASILTKWNQIFSSGFWGILQSSWAVVFAVVLVLFLYDYALGLLIAFYQKRIRKTVTTK